MGRRQVTNMADNPLDEDNNQMMGKRNEQNKDNNHIDPSKIRKIIENIKNKNGGQTSENN